MRREGEQMGQDYEKKKIENRGEFLQYLVRVAGDANYPVSIRRKALDIHHELQKYPTLSFQDRDGQDVREVAVSDHFAELKSLFVEIRQLLIASNKGDSECAEIMRNIHERLI